MFTFKPGHALLLVFVMIFLGACSDDDPVELPAATEPGFATRELAVEAFRGTYREMNLDTMDAVLHPDFELILQPETIEEFQLTEGLFDRRDQMRAAARMFSGLDVTNPVLGPVPALSSLDFALWQQLGTWEEVVAGQLFAGHQFGLFEIDMIGTRTASHTTRVRGQIYVYLARTDTVRNGAAHSYWQVIGIRDLTGGDRKSAESIPWGSLQALYWIPE